MRWSRDGTEIPSTDSRYSMGWDGDVYSLRIRDATEADSGSYRVTARSSAGETYHDYQVKVSAKQVSPT